MAGYGSLDYKVGQGVKHWRLKRGYTQEELARKIGTTRQVVLQYEKGTRRISIEKLYAIVEALSISIKDLIPVSKSCFENEGEEILNLVYEKSLEVYPGFGNLKLKANCNCVIQPADSQCFPDSNKVQVILWNKCLESVDPKVNVELSENNDYIRAEIETTHSEYLCQLLIPFKYDVDAVMKNGASLNVKSLESFKIDITSAKGSVKTENIKTEDLTVTMENASLSLDGAFQGNLHINAKELNFRAKRLQGENLLIQTSHLDTDIESSYMSRGNIFVDRGNLNIKNLHGSTCLHLLNGNLSVNGLHGKLMAIVNEGKLNIHISELIDDSLIELKKGSIDLSFMNLSNKNVKVVAPQLNVHSDLIAFGSHSSTDGMQNFVTTFNSGPTLHVEVESGSINLSKKDWFSSLGIKSDS